MLCLLFHDALPFLSPKHLLPQNKDKKGDWERIVGVSDHHPPASQSLINIKPPKPLTVMYIYIYISKFGTLFFSQNTWCPPLSFQILSCNPLLPQNQNPKTQNLDAIGVIEEAMSNPKTLMQPLKQVLEFSWDFFFF